MGKILKMRNSLKGERKNEESVKIDRAQVALKVVSEQFGLDPDSGWSLLSWKDKGSSCEIEVFNGDFVLKVTVRDTVKWGISEEEEES